MNGSLDLASALEEISDREDGEIFDSDDGTINLENVSSLEDEIAVTREIHYQAKRKKSYEHKSKEQVLDHKENNLNQLYEDISDSDSYREYKPKRRKRSQTKSRTDYYKHVYRHNREEFPKYSYRNGYNRKKDYSSTSDREVKDTESVKYKLKSVASKKKSNIKNSEKYLKSKNSILSSDSDTSDELKRKKKKLKDALTIDSTNKSDLKQRLMQMMGKDDQQNVEKKPKTDAIVELSSDEDTDLLRLRLLALKSKNVENTDANICNKKTAGDNSIVIETPLVDNVQSIEMKSDESSGNNNIENESEEVLQLRIQALKSAMIRKHLARKNKTVEEQADDPSAQNVDDYLVPYSPTQPVYDLSQNDSFNSIYTVSSEDVYIPNPEVNNNPTIPEDNVVVSNEASLTKPLVLEKEEANESEKKLISRKRVRTKSIGVNKNNEVIPAKITAVAKPNVVKSANNKALIKPLVTKIPAVDSTKSALNNKANKMSKHESLEEDEDILRAMLLTTLSNKVADGTNLNKENMLEVSKNSDAIKQSNNNVKIIKKTVTSTKIINKPVTRRKINKLQDSKDANIVIKPKIPEIKVPKLIINLGSDSDTDDELFKTPKKNQNNEKENQKVSTQDFEKSLDIFLKTARSKIESTADNESTIIEKGKVSLQPGDTSNLQRPVKNLTSATGSEQLKAKVNTEKVIKSLKRNSVLKSGLRATSSSISKLTTSPTKVAVTPKIIKHMSAAQQREYRQLVQRILLLEKKKKLKTNTNVSADIKALPKSAKTLVQNQAKAKMKLSDNIDTAKKVNDINKMELVAASNILQNANSTKVLGDSTKNNTTIDLTVESKTLQNVKAIANFAKAVETNTKTAKDIKKRELNAASNILHNANSTKVLGDSTKNNATSDLTVESKILQNVKPIPKSAKALENNTKENLVLLDYNINTNSNNTVASSISTTLKSAPNCEQVQTDNSKSQSSVKSYLETSNTNADTSKKDTKILKPDANVSEIKLNPDVKNIVLDTDPQKRKTFNLVQQIVAPTAFIDCINLMRKKFNLTSNTAVSIKDEVVNKSSESDENFISDGKIQDKLNIGNIDVKNDGKASVVNAVENFNGSKITQLLNNDHVVDSKDQVNSISSVDNLNVCEQMDVVDNKIGDISIVVTSAGNTTNVNVANDMGGATNASTIQNIIDNKITALANESMFIDNTIQSDTCDKMDVFENILPDNKMEVIENKVEARVPLAQNIKSLPSTVNTIPKVKVNIKTNDVNMDPQKKVLKYKELHDKEKRLIKKRMEFITDIDSLVKLVAKAQTEIDKETAIKKEISDLQEQIRKAEEKLGKQKLVTDKLLENVSAGKRKLTSGKKQCIALNHSCMALGSQLSSSYRSPMDGGELMKERVHQFSLKASNFFKIVKLRQNENEVTQSVVDIKKSDNVDTTNQSDLLKKTGGSKCDPIVSKSEDETTSSLQIIASNYSSPLSSEHEAASPKIEPVDIPDLRLKLSKKAFSNSRFKNVIVQFDNRKAGEDVRRKIEVVRRHSFGSEENSNDAKKMVDKLNWLMQVVKDTNKLENDGKNTKDLTIRRNISGQTKNNEALQLRNQVLKSAPSTKHLAKKNKTAEQADNPFAQNVDYSVPYSPTQPVHDLSQNDSCNSIHTVSSEEVYVPNTKVNINPSISDEELGVVPHEAPLPGPWVPVEEKAKESEKKLIPRKRVRTKSIGNNKTNKVTPTKITAVTKPNLAKTVKHKIVIKPIVTKIPTVDSTNSDLNNIENKTSVYESLEEELLSKSSNKVADSTNLNKENALQINEKYDINIQSNNDVVKNRTIVESAQNNTACDSKKISEISLRTSNNNNKPNLDAVITNKIMNDSNLQLFKLEQQDIKCSETPNSKNDNQVFKLYNDQEKDKRETSEENKVNPQTSTVTTNIDNSDRINVQTSNLNEKISISDQSLETKADTLSRSDQESLNSSPEEKNMLIENNTHEDSEGTNNQSILQKCIDQNLCKPKINSEIEESSCSSHDSAYTLLSSQEDCSSDSFINSLDHMSKLQTNSDYIQYPKSMFQELSKKSMLVKWFQGKPLIKRDHYPYLRYMKKSSQAKQALNELVDIDCDVLKQDDDCGSDINEVVVDDRSVELVKRNDSEVQIKDNCELIEIEDSSNSSDVKVIDNGAIRTTANSLESKDTSCNKQLKFKVMEYNSPLDNIQNSSSKWKCSDPNAILCPYELMGSCRDQECQYKHLSN